MISGDTATLLLPGVLTALLYAALLFVLATRHRAAAGPPGVRGPSATPPPARAPPRLRLVAGGRSRVDGPSSGRRPG